MNDIFISYSRKDSALALELAERFRSAGVDVWIDQQGIGGAEQWATEIVEGIRACSTFIVLLSPNSTQSENVLRELSLASEKRKRVLPVDIEPTILPSSFEYPLAGLQRVSISDFDAILRAHKHGVSRVAVKDTRKSLIVLPFEDLSPAGEDNGWFADGLASELIDSLGHIKSLRLIDRKTAMDLKGFRGKTMEIANALQVRYFIEGSVRKFGEQIKISVSLLDIESGDYLWQDSHRGEFKDIFDIQEAVANNVVIGLKLHLTKDEEEKSLIEMRGTGNAEAYELYLKAREYFARGTKEGFELAVQLHREAIKLDPNYANSYVSKATALTALFSNYEHDPSHLVEAESAVKEAIRLKPDLWIAYYPLSTIYWLQGKLKEAEETTADFVQKAHDYWGSHFARGFFYMQTAQYTKAIPPFAEAVRLNPESFVSLWNLAVVCDGAGENEERSFWATRAIPIAEKHLKLHPDDEGMRVKFASLLHFAGRLEEARIAGRSLLNVRDGASLYNTARLFSLLGEPLEALRIFRMSIEAGFGSIRHIKMFLQEDMASIRDTPEYEEVSVMVKKLSEPEPFDKLRAGTGLH